MLSFNLGKASASASHVLSCNLYKISTIEFVPLILSASIMILLLETKVSNIF